MWPAFMFQSRSPSPSNSPVTRAETVALMSASAACIEMTSWIMSERSISMSPSKRNSITPTATPSSSRVPL